MPSDAHTLNLSGGLIDTPYTSLSRNGDAVVINHSGGTFDAGFLDIEGNATYNLSGTGELIATDITGSTGGVFLQTGGTVTVANNLSIDSLYDLQSGSLNVDTATVNNATFNVGVGSTFNYNGLSLNGGSINGLTAVDSGRTFSISSGTWNNDLVVGSGSAGTATLSGGTVNGNLELGALGTASINDVEVVGSLILDGTVTSIGGVVVGGSIINNTSIAPSFYLTSNGVTNNGELTLTGGDSGSGSFTNSSQLSLTGTITGSGGFTNNGQLIQGSGAINLSNSGGSTNNGTMELSFDRGLTLSAADFTNNNILNMRNNTISGATNLINSAAGTINGDGRIAVDINNAGTINARSGNLSVAGSSFTNTGLVKNSVGANLFIDAISVSHTGSIETNATGSVVFNSAISNTSGQTVTLNGGTLSTPTLTNAVGGTISGFGTISGNVSNSGQVDLFGASTISGNLTNQSSGTITIRNDTTLITGQTTNNGTIETLNGNVIFEGGLINNGALLFDPSTLTLSDLTVSSDGFLAESGDPGDRIIITGDMVNQSVQNTSWQTSNTIFQFNGGARDVSNPQFLEAAGADVGNILAGWSDNFAFGTLEIGTSDTYVKLVDDFDNSAMCLTSYCEIWDSEALYVGDFILEAGATLDLMGLNLYVLNSLTNNGGFIINGTVTVGAVVPVPAAVWLFSSGLLGLVGAARKKKSQAV